MCDKNKQYCDKKHTRYCTVTKTGGFATKTDNIATKTNIFWWFTINFCLIYLVYDLTVHSLIVCELMQCPLSTPALGIYLIEDGLIWADEGPLVHGLLAVSQGHRVADMEQLRQEEWKSNNFHLNIQKSYFVRRNYLWDVFIMNIQRGYNFSRSYVQFFCELETIKCRVLSRSLNWLKYNNYTTFGAIICQQFS